MAERKEGMANEKMSVLVLNGDDMLRGAITRHLQEVEELEVHDLGIPLPNPVPEIARSYKPQLIIMSWKDFGARTLTALREHCSPKAQIWVYSGYDPRHIREAAGTADLILSNILVSMRTLTALAQDLARAVIPSRR